MTKADPERASASRAMRSGYRPNQLARSGHWSPQFHHRLLTRRAW